MISSAMRRFYIYATVFGIAFLLLFVPVVIPMISREADCSVFNRSWNGSSTFYYDYLMDEGIDTMYGNEETYLNTALTSLSSLDIMPDDTMILILGPTSGYGDDELEYIRTYLESGGAVILCDDFGTGNEILSSLGVSERFSNQLMLDLAYDMSGTFPVAYRSEDMAFSYTLLLNSPSTITGATSPLLYSSATGFIDSDEDHLKDEGEAFGPFVIASSVEYGAGRLLLVSDPSIFINAMIDEKDNYEAAVSLIRYAGGDRALYVDEAHYLAASELRVVDIVVSTTHNTLFMAVVIVLIFALALYEAHALSLLRGVARKMQQKIMAGRQKVKKDITKEELVKELSLLHPEWDTRSLYQYFSKFR